MKDQFKTLFRIDCAHTFYTNGRCGDFTLQPTAATAQLLRSRRCVFRWGGDTGAVIYQLNETATLPLTAFQTNEALAFTIINNSADFFHFTTDLEVPAIGKINLYRNVSRTVTAGYLGLTKTEAILTAGVITHKIKTNSAASIELRNREGVIISTGSIAAGSQHKEYQFDIQSLPAGLYEVRETVGAGQPDITSYYADAQLPGSRIFGILLIENKTSYPYDYSGNDAYKLGFTAKSGTWNYYLVMPSTGVATQYYVEDKSNGENHYSNDLVGPIVFNRVTSIPSTDKVAPMLQKPGKTVVLFQSAQPVAFRQKARRLLQLLHKTQVGNNLVTKVIVADLSNPDIRKTGTNLFIYI
ncbi:MAG: hypothetical protein MUC87_20495 [Bacteroidia bacterium]|jgi:hypothetical protein|nr:hypothetical protein [Bacteroidia bacterium]